MTIHEKELLDLVRKSEDPEQAIITAISIITNFLKQLESFQ